MPAAEERPKLSNSPDSDQVSKVANLAARRSQEHLSTGRPAYVLICVMAHRPAGTRESMN